MLQFARWKVIGIIASLVLAIFFALPNVLPKSSQDILAKFGARPMTLGLDLQGGSNVLMEMDKKDLTANLLKQLASDIRQTLREAKIGYQDVRAGADSVSVRINNEADLVRARTELGKLLQPVETGLFASGAGANVFELSNDGQLFALKFSDTGLQAKIAKIIAQMVGILGNRLDSSGVAEATIQQQGQDRISIQLPGVQNPDEIIKRLGTTAKLTFQLLCDSQPTGENQSPPGECTGYPLKDDPKREMWVKTSSLATVDGADLTDAQPSFDQNNRAVVTFRFNQKGALRFGKLTTDNVGRPFAIVLDKKVVSYPNINEPILGGSGQISGNFSTEETKDLSIVLRSGALPANIVPVEQRTVGPSLGSDSIRAGFVASVIGLVLVIVFMVVAYGLFGIFADIALLINLLLLIAVMSFVGFTLTLPGIAGIVLTMGMAVDSNVIIFERMREEWRNGRTAINSIETGFKQAFATIIDSNSTALIAAVVLFGVGSGPVRGFAVTHVIGILTTMFTAYTVTRYIVSLWVKRTKPKEVPL